MGSCIVVNLSVNQQFFNFVPFNILVQHFSRGIACLLECYINLFYYYLLFIKDAQSLPRIEDSLNCLDGATIFTSLDLQSGYWQVEMTEASIPLTAFTVGPLGFYKCVQMPFGLTNALATFQHLMETCLGELHLKWCIIYLDDMIVFSKTPEEHIERLRGVFEKLSAAGLRLKPS